MSIPIGNKVTLSVFSKVPNSELAIQVLNIRKSYPAVDGNKPKLAVKGVSFGVPDSSCFGILGHNGLGFYVPIHLFRCRKNDIDSYVDWSI